MRRALRYSALFLALAAAGCKEVVSVPDERPLDAPANLWSISLDGAIHLQWDDNAYESDPARFSWYRIYSTGYDLDRGVCDVSWVVEGTTVAPEFLVSAMTNGVPRCFGVTALSREGVESAWSRLWQDTPRPDARNTLVFALQSKATEAGFRFWDDVNGDRRGQTSELGLVGSGNAGDIDFRVSRGVGDTMWIEPVFTGTGAIVYGQVTDLTSIDFAPDTVYGRNALQAVPTYGYVFEIDDASGLHYGALRVSHVGREYVIFDWSLQTDPGNPELMPRAGLLTSPSTGSQVSGSR